MYTFANRLFLANSISEITKIVSEACEHYGYTIDPEISLEQNADWLGDLNTKKSVQLAVVLHTAHEVQEEILKGVPQMPTTRMICTNGLVIR
jgi:uncharacterized protein YciW